MTLHENELKEQIELKIEQGSVTKHSKGYFLFRQIAFGVGFLFAIGITLYLASFVFFVAHQPGFRPLTAFGSRGYLQIIRSLPWALFAVTLFLAGMIELIAWRFAAIYRRPLIYSLLFICAVIVGASLLIERSTFHPMFFRSAERRHMPFVGDFYRRFGRHNWREVTFGTVLNQSEQSWQIQNKDGDLITVRFTADTRFPRGKDIVPGDPVIIIGRPERGEIMARGISKVPPEAAPEF